MSYKDAFTEELVLPSNLKAECAVLASVLLDPAALPRVAPVLAAEDFFNQKHQRIYSAMLALRDRSAEIEPVALLMELNGAGDGTGPDPVTDAYVSGLDDGKLDAQNVKEYARTVKEFAVRRRFISAAQKLDQRARSPEANVRMLAEDVGAEIQIVGRSLLEPATAGQRSPLKSHTLAELEAMEIPERELIVSPVLARQETAFIYGPKGTSKTWTAVGIAAVAAQGGGARFLNFVNDGPGVLTVYVDGEMLSRDIRQRVRDICRTSNLNPGDNLRIWTPDAQPEGTPPLNLFTEEGREMLENHLSDIEEETGRKVELVVIDNLRTLCPGWEENAAESFMPIAVWTIRLRAKGKATILLHHSNKTGGYSGNTAIVSTVHAILKIARPEGYTADQGASFDLTYEWTRARPDGLENFSARLEGDAWSVKQTGHVADELIRILSAQGLSIREIADQIGKGRDYVSRRQNEARAGQGRERRGRSQMTERQEQALEALRTAAEEAAAAGTLPDFFAEVERAKTGALIAAARPGSPMNDPGKEYGLVEAAAVLGRSERWLRGHRRQLRIGSQLAGRGPWRFTQKELERVRESARRRRS